jgi:hypothetical protein
MLCSTPWRGKSASLFIIGLLLCWGMGGSALASNAQPEIDSKRVSPQAVSHPQLAGSRLQGEATLRFWGLRIYTARLWALPTFNANPTPTQPLVLELEYLRDLKGSAIAERSLQEMKRAGTFTESQAQRWLADMQRIFPDVKSGDRLSGLHQPGQGAAFWYNGRPAGQIDDAEFARLFFAIWLAPTTSEPDMRQALLGLNPPNGR